MKVYSNVLKIYYIYLHFQAFYNIISMAKWFPQNDIALETSDAIYARWCFMDFTIKRYDFVSAVSPSYTKLTVFFSFYLQGFLFPRPALQTDKAVECFLPGASGLGGILDRVFMFLFLVTASDQLSFSFHWLSHWLIKREKHYQVTPSKIFPHITISAYRSEQIEGNDEYIFFSWLVFWPMLSGIVVERFVSGVFPSLFH